MTPILSLTNKPDFTKYKKIALNNKMVFTMSVLAYLVVQYETLWKDSYVLDQQL